MTKVCTHGRDAKTAMRQLEQSLRRLKTDYLDLWQIHECVYYNDPERHFARGGVIEALERAKQQGKVRYVGLHRSQGSRDPPARCCRTAIPFDSCQLPLNGFDATFRSFEQRVLPELQRAGIAPLGMKSLGGDGAAVKKQGGHAGRRAALRDEPAGGDDRQRHRLDARPAQNLRDRAGLQADDARADGRLPPPAARPTRPTAASSCTRRPRSTTATKGASSTASRPGRARRLTTSR